MTPRGVRGWTEFLGLTSSRTGMLPWSVYLGLAAVCGLSAVVLVTSGDPRRVWLLFVVLGAVMTAYARASWRRQHRRRS